MGEEELGHTHLDGAVHLATTPAPGARMVAEGLGTPFRWARGWTLASVAALGEEGAVDLFRRNYARIVGPAADGGSTCAAADQTAD